MWWKQRTELSIHTASQFYDSSSHAVFFLVSQHRHRKQLRTEITNNSSITNTIFISCARSFHNLCFSGRPPLVTASGLVVPGDHWARAGEAAGVAVTSQKAVLNHACLWELPSRMCFRKPGNDISPDFTSASCKDKDETRRSALPSWKHHRKCFSPQRINYWSSKQCAMHSLCSLSSCTLCWTPLDDGRENSEDHRM